MSHSHRIGSNAPNTSRRHLPDQRRRSHGGFFDPTMPTDGLYGSQIDREFVDRTDLGGVYVTPGTISDEAVTPETFDTTPPDVPTGLGVTSSTYVSSDGAAGVRLVITLTHATATDLLGAVIHVTNDYTGTTETPVEDFSFPSEHFLDRTATTLIVNGVQGATTYWVRARSRDVQGNDSDWTATVSCVTVDDAVAPDAPEGVVAVAGFRGAIVKWGKSSARDLSHYIVRYCLDSAGVPSNVWTEVQTLVNLFWVAGLTPDAVYWFSVAAVDRSGNVSTYSTEVTCTPSAVGAADIAAGSVSAVHIDVDGLDANVIKTGILGIEAGSASRADGITIYDSASSNPFGMVAHWDEDGLVIYESTSLDRRLVLTGGGLELWEGTNLTAAITVDGISASAISFGRMQGGSNVVPNSSFETGSYAVDSTLAHTGFSTGAAATNATYSGGNITITTLP